MAALCCLIVREIPDKCGIFRITERLGESTIPDHAQVVCLIADTRMGVEFYLVTKGAVMKDLAWHQQPQDRDVAGCRLPHPQPEGHPPPGHLLAPVDSVHWVTFKDSPEFFHLVNHAVFDGLLQLKYVTWCGRAQHATRIAPAGDDPRIPAYDQCPICVNAVQRFVDHADQALKGR